MRYTVTTNQAKILRHLSSVVWTRRKDVQASANIGKSFNTTIARLIRKGLIRRQHEKGKQAFYKRTISHWRVVPTHNRSKNKV